MSTVAKRHDETGVISFRKSANSDETVEVRKEDYGDAMEMAGEDADDSITPVMEMLHQTVQQVVAADAAPEEKAAAITKSFQEAMMLLGEGINGTDEEPGLIEKCLITGAVLVQKFGQVEKTAEGSQDNTTGGAGEEVKKGNDDMANDAEVAELRKKLADMEDRNRLTEIKDELRKAGIPLENADVLLKLEKSDKAAAEQMLKSLTGLASQVKKSALLAEAGSAGGSAIIEKGDRLKAAATEIRKSHPNMTESQAIAKALETNAELRAAYEAGEI